MKMPKLDFKNPKVRNPVLIILLGIGALLLWYQQVYTPTQLQIKDLEAKRKQKQQELNTVLALKPQLNILKKEISNSQVQLDSLRSIFPDQKEVPKLIREITGVASAAGIYTTRFVPMPDVQKEYYVENKYAITVVGGFHQLAEFFSFLANFPLIINLSTVIIMSNPEFETMKQISDEQGVAPSSIVASFDLTTFSSKK